MIKFIQLLTIVFVILVGVAVYVFLTTPELVPDRKYSLGELKLKYPTAIDLKHGIDTGELDYDKLPVQAKTALTNFTSSDFIINLKNEK